ncbi:unnamed protein product [Trichobilharzia regenti]|nr:unnamed protein product [Trichobilharzia regenti]
MGSRIRKDRVDYESVLVTENHEDATAHYPCGSGSKSKSREAGVTVRACRPEDHIFILMQLLRLPSSLIKLFVCLLQPPDPTVAWERTKNLVEFLYQPEVELILTLFAICLRPVRERERFVTSINTTTNNKNNSSSKQTDSDSNKEETPWTTVDSAGESDTEDKIDLSNKQKKTSMSKLFEIPSTTNSQNDDSCAYLNPDDLSCLLGQLRIERLLQLLAYDYYTPGDRPSSGEYHQEQQPQQHQMMNESGLMTSIAFADRVLCLIEACEKIYADYAPQPTAQTHLGAWRALAKRLARLIRSVVVCDACFPKG